MEKVGQFVAVLSLLAWAGADAAEQAPRASGDSNAKVPRIDGEYVNVYKPAGDVFPGPSVGELVAGRRYEEWVPNDHCFVKDTSGRWHAFGITHPRTDLDNVHQGENQSFHAVAPRGPLMEVLKQGAWKDLPKVLPPAERPADPDDEEGRRSGIAVDRSP